MAEAISENERPLARDHAAEAGWSERPLTTAERARLRSHYPVRRGPDLAYLGPLAGFVCLFTLFGFAVLTRMVGMPGRALPALVALTIGVFIAVAYNPKRLRHAFLPRRARVPRRVWVWPAEVSRWCGRDRQGNPVHEIRCTLDGQLRSVAVTPEQWAAFPEGPARVEVLPGGRRRLYRFRFAAETVQVYPEVFTVREGDDGLARPAEKAVGKAAVIGADSSGHSGRRRKRHRSSPRGRAAPRMRRQDWIWLSIAVVVGGGFALLVLQTENRAAVPPPITGKR